MKDKSKVNKNFPNYSKYQPMHKVIHSSGMGDNRAARRSNIARARKVPMVSYFQSPVHMEHVKAVKRKVAKRVQAARSRRLAREARK